MPRPLRPDIENGWHHVMNRGIDHADVFFGDSDRVEFGQRLADIHDRFAVRTIAYCLMDNHFHLLVHCPFGGLSVAMQRLGSLYTRHVNDRLGRDGPIFRGRFHSRLVSGERHLLAAVRYIHRNALDLPGVERASDYRWSSHRTYLGFRRPPDWLDMSMVLERWNPPDFDRFVDGEFDTGLRASPLTVKALLEAIPLVLAECGVPDDARLGAVGRRVVLAWAVAAGVGDDVLMEIFGQPSVPALRKASRRAQALVAAEPALAMARRRAIDLISCDMDITGQTRDVRQRAARAAS